MTSFVNPVSLEQKTKSVQKTWATRSDLAGSVVHDREAELGHHRGDAACSSFPQISYSIARAAAWDETMVLAHMEGPAGPHPSKPGRQRFVRFESRDIVDEPA